MTLVDPRLVDSPPRSLRGLVGVLCASAAALSATLEAQREQASLFRLLATLRTDAPTIAGVDELRWQGPRPDFEAVARALGQASLFTRAQQLAARLPAA